MTHDLRLPPTLRTKLAALARRIRRLRAARGLSLLVLALVFLSGGLFAADLLWELPAEALRWGLVAIAAGAFAVAAFGLVLPLCRRLDPEALAALIEQRYPQLAERLTSAVELSGQSDGLHGSRALIDLLIEETERHSSALDFGRAMPARRTWKLAAAAAVAVLLAAMPALFWGEAYTNFADRLRLTWASPSGPGAPNLVVEVVPQGGFAASGRPIAVVALVHARDGSAPDSAVLVATDARGKATRTRLMPDASVLPAVGAATAAFAVSPLHGLPLSASAPMLAGVGTRTRAFVYRTERLSGDLAFHVEAAAARSDSVRVTAVRPVELAADSPSVTVAAPAYANSLVHPEQKLHGLTELTSFEFGRVRFDFEFTRPAVVANVEIAERPAAGAPRRWLLPVALDAGRQRGRFEVPALAAGVYELRLILEAEHRIETAYDLRPLTVTHDGPPVFVTKPDAQWSSITDGRPEWVIGSDPLGGEFKPIHAAPGTANVRAVAPADTLRLKFAAEDAVGLDGVELEYRVNDGPVKSERIVEARGQRRAEPSGGAYPFALAGKVKDGDVLLFRLKAADNRTLARHAARDADGRPVPSADLPPQAAYLPARDRWYAVRVSRSADPLAKQEILDQRDAFRQQLDAAIKKVAAERALLDKVRNETKPEPKLSADQLTALGQVRRDHRELTADVRQLAQTAAEEPSLRPLAAVAADVAGNELRGADDALAQAQDRKDDAARRAPAFDRAAQDLALAQKKLEALRQQNDRLARDRLDRQTLEGLAERQQELARKADELAGKDTKDNPEAKKEFDAIRAEQSRLAEELQRLTQQSESLRNALEAMRAERARQVADEAAELARQQRELNQAAAAARQQAEGRINELIRRQQELANKVTQLAQQTKALAQTAGQPPLRSDDARKAAEALGQRNFGEALQKQDAQAKELDRGAQDWAKAPEPGRDLRAAAQQLAQRQRQLADATKPVRDALAKATPQERPGLEQKLAKIGEDQAELNRQAAQIPVTDPTKAAAQQAREAMNQAQQALARKDGAEARRKQQDAAAALERLAQQLPGKAQGPPPKEQAGRALALAKEQRDIRAALEKLAGPVADPRRPEQEKSQLGELARTQRDLARAAAELAKDVAKDHGKDAPATKQAQKAAGGTKQAADKAQAGATTAAQQSGAKAAQDLRDLAKGLTGAKAPDLAQRAAALAKQQDELNRQTQPHAANAAAQKGQQVDRQADLAKQADDLMNALGKFGQGGPAAQAEAAKAVAKQAQEAMAQAHAQMKQGNEGKAAQPADRAAQLLNRVAQLATQAAQQMAAAQKPGSESGKPAAEAVKQGQEQMGQAQGKLGQGQPGEAKGAMEKAADSLKQAAAQVGKQGDKPGVPGEFAKDPGKFGAAPGGLPDLGPLSKELQKYAGRPWGEVPGELRTRILQDMRARYGEDYAGIIQQYFERIADTNRAKRE